MWSDNFFDHLIFIILCSIRKPSLAETSLICTKVWKIDPNKCFILKSGPGSGQNSKILLLNFEKNVTWHFWTPLPHVSFGSTISNPLPPRVSCIIWMTPHNYKDTPKLHLDVSKDILMIYQRKSAKTYITKYRIFAKMYHRGQANLATFYCKFILHENLECLFGLFRMKNLKQPKQSIGPSES